MQLKNKKYILSISGGNIITSLGGTEKVIISHQKLFNIANISYVYIFPVSKKIAGYELFYYWAVIIDGKIEGLFTTGELLSFISSPQDDSKLLLKIHIHHLRGIKLYELSEILDYIKTVDIFFYLHDYYLLCDQYTLKNTSGTYCGVGIPSQSKCKNCGFWKSNAHSEKRREFLFKYLDRITLIAPSECPAEIIGDSIPAIKNKVKVVYHQKALGQYAGNKRNLHRKTIKIAFCGLPIGVKGWEDFLYVSKLAVEKGADINFYHLGKKSEDYAHITNIPIGFQDGCKTMTEALRELEIDCVILWSNCPETYSYVYFECFAANAFVIANSNSGNIANQVLLNGNGIVLNSKEELLNFLLDSQRLKKLIYNYKTSQIYGPLELAENDEIVSLSVSDGVMIQPIKCKGIGIKKKIIEKLYLLHLKKKQC